MIAFINPLNNIHLYSFAGSLMLNGVVRPSDLVIYHNSEKFELKAKDKFNAFAGFENFKSMKQYERDDLTVFSKIHFLSLTPQNAPYIVALLNKNKDLKNNIFILLTDDEVNRWRRVYQIFGKLRPIKRYKIDRKVIEVLEKIDNYVINEAFGVVLKGILNRDIYVTNFTIYVPDKYLPMEDEKIETQKDSIAIIFDSRPPSPVMMMWFLLSLMYIVLVNKNAVSINTDIYIWNNSMKGLMGSILNALNKVTCWLIKVRKVEINIKQMTRMPYTDYQQMLANMDFMIFRERGGVGGGLTFVDNNGVLLIPNKSLNADTFEEYIGEGAFDTYRSYREALKKIFRSDYAEFDEKVRIGKRHYRNFQRERNIFFKEFYKLA